MQAFVNETLAMTDSFDVLMLFVMFDIDIELLYQSKDDPFILCIYNDMFFNNS